MNKKWAMCTFVMKHYNKAKNQGWTQTVEYVYINGSVCGGCFEAPARAITIRNVEKKQMSDAQFENLLDENDE